MKKDLIYLIISWTIVLFLSLTVQVEYKEDYQDVFIFLSFFVVLIPLIFSTTWRTGILNTIISFLGILLITFMFWYISSLGGDFSFENKIPYLYMTMSAVKGFILGAFLKFVYLKSQ